MRESDATCLVVSAAMHSGRGRFLHVLTPATSALLPRSALPEPWKPAFIVGTGPRRESWGLWDAESSGQNSGDDSEM